MGNLYIQWTEEVLVLSRWNKISAVVRAAERLSVPSLQRCNSEKN